MTPEQKFEKSNKAEHKVENQWHYPILTKYGFKAETKVGVGFVRSYTHPWRREDSLHDGCQY